MVVLPDDVYMQMTVVMMMPEVEEVMDLTMTETDLMTTVTGLTMTETDLTMTVMMMVPVPMTTLQPTVQCHPLNPRCPRPHSLLQLRALAQHQISVKFKVSKRMHSVPTYMRNTLDCLFVV